MDVSKCMSTKLILTGLDCTYKNLLAKIVAASLGQIYVVDDQYKLLGVITTYDLLQVIAPSYMSSKLAASITDGTDFMQKQVEKVKDKCAVDIMSSDFTFLKPKQQLALADSIIVETGCNALPVLDEHGKLLGEVSRTDILKRFVDKHMTGTQIKPEIVDLSKV